MDLSALNSILRVNGLTAQSAPANIRDVLLRSGFSVEEIPAALAILAGAPPQGAVTASGARAMTPMRNGRAARFVYNRVSIFAGRIGILQFWLGMILTIVLYGLTFVVVEVSAVPLFTILSGISLFSPPDLSTASVSVLLLFGTGIVMLVLPALFFLIVIMGLQIRRCHDYGLSSSTWFMAVLALSVGGYLLYRLTPLGVLASVIPIALWVVLVSWPGMSQQNIYGNQGRYPSIWGAMRGSVNQGDGFFTFIKQFLLPLVYLEILGIFFGLCVHIVLPHVHAPTLP